LDGSVDSSDFAAAIYLSATAMNAAAHSSLSRVLMEAKASATSAGSGPMSGYIPFCARFPASDLISSRVRSVRSCADARIPAENDGRSKRVAGQTQGWIVWNLDMPVPH